MKRLDVIIFGAGPAGLAAALKLAEDGKETLVIEKDSQVGGISKTIGFKNFRFDLGSHRFFSKSSEVNRLWSSTLGNDFLLLKRLTRIYYRNKFFAYPIKLWEVIFKLGFFDSVGILLSYIESKLFPYKKEDNFEEWVSNRFGKKLFKTFFKTYTEKLWGVPCDQIQAEWAAQRIKGLSFSSAIKNAIFRNKKDAIKTLIHEFHYPRYGAGMMYEKMAENVQKMGGKIIMETAIERINHNGSGKIKSIVVKNKNGEISLEADFFISSLPITELISKMRPIAPEKVLAAAQKLKYRSLVTVNIILESASPFPDNWIYLHSPSVRMSRIQNLNNWGPGMVIEKNKTALCLEYFCDENDAFWNENDDALIKLGLAELKKLTFGRPEDFADGFVARVPKAYPVYDATYPENIRIIREYLKNFQNLQPIGRYGMFKYNNMDHSILTGLYAAKNILGEKHDIWNINSDRKYQEEK